MLTSRRGYSRRSSYCGLYEIVAAFRAVSGSGIQLRHPPIGVGIPDSGLLATLPSGVIILRRVPGPTTTRAFRIAVRLSPPTRERLRFLIWGSGY
jgi:hypothetical protein